MKTLVDFTPVSDEDTCFRCGRSYQKTGGFPKLPNGARDHDFPCQGCNYDDYCAGRETVRRTSNE